MQEQRESHGNGLEIAIVGMAGRFPGAPDIDVFWKNLCAGVESVQRFTDEQLRKRGVPTDVLADPNYVKAGMPFEGIDQFAAEFFGYTPRDAEHMDPQQRLLLECAWEALEHAGYDPQRCAGKTGIYAGSGPNVYLMRHLLPRFTLENENVSELLGLLSGNSSDSLCTRIAYKLNLCGPAVSIQTACSTSLMAVHVACQALLCHECDMALAGGVSLSLLQGAGYRHQPGAILSPDGHCRAFDANAAGTLPGSGAGIVVLKRLEDANNDGDTIHAVIKGSAANNDGSSKVGFTAPSVQGQASAIRAAQAAAGVPADTIGYVEAHGTGTTLGDPIEIAALTQAFRASTSRLRFCAIGSVKTNIGHLDAAAGVTGLIKTVLALENRVLPASLNFERPNPRIDFDNSPFYVNTTTQPWADGAHPRRAGVSSFGIGGTNVHVILEAAPRKPVPADTGRALHVLPLSARSEKSLRKACRRLAEHLRGDAEQSLADVAYTLFAGRKRFDHRAAVLASDVADAVDALEKEATSSRAGSRVLSDHPSVAFLFPGQGAQHVAMGRALYDREPVFREAVDRCCERLAPALAIDLRELLYPKHLTESEAALRLEQTAITQPALFVVEYAMAQLWMSWGVKPDALLGHSIGEYVAACLAGVFSLEAALDIVAARGRLLQATPAGGMLAVSLSEAELQPYLHSGCDLAAVNAPELCVLSGSTQAISQAEQDLVRRGVAARRLHVSHAFHSALVEPMLGELEALLSGVKLSAPSIAFVSNLSGHWITADEACSPSYWARHMRGTVRFAAGLRELLMKPDRVLLEVGPGETLTSLARRHADAGERRPILSSQCHPDRRELNAEQPARCVAQLWMSGVEIDAAAWLGKGRRRVPLPTYPFERQSYWVEPLTGTTHGGLPRTPLANATATARDMADWFYVPNWKRTEPINRAASCETTAAASVVVLCDAYGFGDRLLQHLQASGRPLLRVSAGEKFARLGERHYAVRPSEREDFVQLLRAIESEAGEISHICHLWSLDREDVSREPNEIFERSFHSLLALAQALGDIAETSGERKVSLTVVTNRLEDVTGTEPLCPEKAVLHGPCKVIPQEYPNVACRLIDVVLPGARDDYAQHRLARQIADEMQCADREYLVTYRGPHRWIKTFEPEPREAPATPRLRQRGVYLITGGLGGIGMTLARHLAKAWQARLVLVGRSALLPQDQWLDLESSGGEVMAVQADVTDPLQLRAAIDAARSRFGALHGVIHAAGDAGGGMISNKTRAMVERVFAPKVRGTQTLLSVTAEEPLDFIVFCSSLASLAGGLGKVEYAAANAYLDAVATACARTADRAVVSINWDGWRGIGMGAGVSMPEHVGIDRKHGAAAFEHILGRLSTPQAIVCTTDLDFRLRHIDQILTEVTQQRVVPGKHERPQEYAQTYVEPKGETELMLAQIWSDLLGIAAIGAEDNLFEMGGDSLLAIQLAARVRQVFEVEVPIREVFAHPVLRQLATRLERQRQSSDRPGFVLTAGVAAGGRKVPLSHAQQRLWFLWRLEPASAALNTAVAFQMTGTLDLAAFRSAVQQLVARHDVLRTVFGEDDGKAWQAVQPTSPFAVPLVDFANPGEEPSQRARSYIEVRIKEPFDLTRERLVRAELLHLGDGSHIFLLVMHHIVTDGWSVNLMMSQFMHCYCAALDGDSAALPDLSWQYADFATAHRQWLEQGEMQRQVDYWRARLEGVAPLVVPPDLPAPQLRSYPGGVCTFALGTALTENVRSLARARLATPFVVLLGAISVVLAERAAQKVFYVGTDMANRNRRETETIVGFFVNQVALPIDCATPQSLAELLAQLQRTVMDASDCQDLPFDRLVEAVPASARGGRAPLFQIKIIYQEDAQSSFALPGLAISRYPLPPPEAELDLIVSFVASRDELRVEIKYDCEVYAATTIEDIQAELIATLDACIENSDIDLARLRSTLQQLRHARQAQRSNLRSKRMAQLRSGLRARSVDSGKSTAAEPRVG